MIDFLRSLDPAKFVSITSLQFAAFVFAVLLIYYFLPRRPQNIWLLAVSYVFAALANWQFAAALLVVTSVNLVLAQKLRAGNLARRGVLWAGIGFNLCVLLFFKNAGFFTDDFASLLSRLGISVAAGGLQILLPLGLSYYTLQAISYLIDVSRGQAAAADWVDFALCLAYFPKLVAGPIERARSFLPKLAQDRVVDNDLLARSFTLIVVGLFRKVVIADPLAASIAGAVFYDPSQFGTLQRWLFLLAYAFSLYNDFAGYTSIVRGVSGLFGIELSPNFNAPYLARSFNEFWNRWHISLSHWLRDYVYLPLSRTLLRRFPNRQHPAHLLLPPMVTMFVSGLWHMSWDHKTIILWGVLHGAYQVIERLPAWLGRPVVPIDEQPRWQQWLRMLVIIVLVTLAWVLFRDNSSIGTVLQVWPALFVWKGAANPDWAILIGIGFSLGLDWLQTRRQDETVFTRWPLLARSALLAFAFFAILLVSQTETIVPFVYEGF